MRISNAASRGAFRALPLLLVVAGLAAYGDSFKGVMVFDDGDAILRNPHVRSLWPIGQALWAPSATTVTGRPVVCLSLALNYALSGFEVWSYHLVNLAIHVLAGLTLFGILRRTLLTPALRERLAGSADWFALAVALLWTVHPLHTEVVTYISTRTEGLMALFLLLTLYGVIRGAAAERARWWYVAAVTACALGMASKQAMIGAPLLVLLYDRAFLAGSFRGALRRRPGVYAGLAGTWIVLGALVATGELSRSAGFHFEHITAYDYLLTQATVILHYLRLAFWPQPLVLSYDDWPIAHTLHEVWPQGLVMLALLAGTLWALYRNTWLGFVGAWFFVVLAPTSSFLPIVTEIAAERRMYLPLAALLVVVVAAWALVLRWAGERGAVPQRYARGVIAALVLLASTAGVIATARRNLDYRSDVGIWRDTLAKRPNNLKAKMIYGQLLYGEDRWDEGISLLQEVVRAHRGGAAAQYNLGLGLTHQSRLAEAAEHYAEALRLEPDHLMARSNYADVLAALGRRDEGLAQLEGLVQRQPNEPIPRAQLGRFYELEGKLKEATEQYSAALRLRPDDARTQNRLGLILAMQGRLPEAEQHLREALRLQPDLAEARLNLAQVLGQRGAFEEAGRQIDTVRQAQPGRAEPDYHWGLLLMLQGRMADAIAAYRRALALAPGWAPPANNLAWILATTADSKLRDPAEAVRLAEQVCRSAAEANPGDLDTLAAAYAAAGRFEEAVQTATRALDLARKAGPGEGIGPLEERLGRYRQRQAYIEPAGPAATPQQ